jgi:two-component system, NtrC family, response regulator HydG
MHKSKNVGKVLVVDDEPNMRKTLSAILRDEGYEVQTADNGEQAVELCKQHLFDVVLMDVRMPKLDGVEAFRRIRRHQEGVRVILMSAYREDQLKREALDDGAIAFIDKPLDVERVIRLIGETTETAILVVADDQDTVKTISESLQRQQYHVTTVSTPHDALEIAEQIRFDIVFIDVQLASMNGLDLYLAIRRITPSAIAIMVSGMEEEFLRVARDAVRRTAFTIINKPIDLDHLFDLLNRIQRQRASDALYKPAS